MKISQLETPCLVLDKQKLTKNINALHQRMQKLGVNLRPHGKTAKCIEVMNMALTGQQNSVCVSTLKEAEYYFSHGITDIIYAVGISPIKMQRSIDLIKRGAQLTLLVDNMEQVNFVAEFADKEQVTIEVLIEIDCDGHRSGVAQTDPILLEIGRALHHNSGTSLAGILTHAGESYNCKSDNELREIAQLERDVAVQCADILRADNLPCETVSVGSTPTANFAQDLSGITEVRAGVFVFYDLVMAGIGVCKVDDIAVSVLTSVIGEQKNKGWIISDAGWMALSRDRGTARQAQDYGYGQVCDENGTPLANTTLSSANQEHGIIEKHGETPIDSSKFHVGSLLRVLPNHACATSAMHDKYYVTDGSDEVVEIWQRINGW